MPEFGRRSRERLSTCHPHLQMVAHEVIPHYDHTIVAGWRGEEAQEQAFVSGRSAKRWPDSKHNHVASEEDVEAGFAPNVGAPLSLGLDVAPWHPEWPHIYWQRTSEFYMLAGMYRGIGEKVLPEGWAIRLGADWDDDGYTEDQEFKDLGHIELVRIS